MLDVEHRRHHVHPLPLDGPRIERSQLHCLEDLLRVDPQPLDRRLRNGGLLLPLARAGFGALAVGYLGRGDVLGALRTAGAQLGDAAHHPGVVGRKRPQDAPDGAEGGRLDLGVSLAFTASPASWTSAGCAVAVSSPTSGVGR